MLIAHRPLPPWWDCAACGQLWPCSTERERLLEEYANRPVELGRHLWQEAERAARYVPRSEEVHERFFAWAGII